VTGSASCVVENQPVSATGTRCGLGGPGIIVPGGREAERQLEQQQGRAAPEARKMDTVFRYMGGTVLAMIFTNCSRLTILGYEDLGGNRIILSRARNSI